MKAVVFLAVFLIASFVDFGVNSFVIGNGPLDTEGDGEAEELETAASLLAHHFDLKDVQGEDAHAHRHERSKRGLDSILQFLYRSREGTRKFGR